MRPKQSTIKAILFDKTHRPKTVSNTLGIKYDTFGVHAMTKKFMGGNITRNNINKANFKEGSGDNMIFGHFLCQKTGVNGIRNTINQDELAICNPKNFFSIYDKEILDIGLRTEKQILIKPKFMNRLRGKKNMYINAPLPRGRLSFNHALLLKNIEFNRQGNSMRYEPSSLLTLLNRYGTSKIRETKAKLALKKLTQ